VGTCIGGFLNLLTVPFRLHVRAVRVGEDAGRWAGAMLEERGIEGVRVLQGFVSLARKYHSGVINQASRIAPKAGMFRLKPLREMVRRHTAQTEMEFSSDHTIIRPLSSLHYG